MKKKVKKGKKKRSIGNIGSMRNSQKWYCYIKRWLDVLFSAEGIVLLGPLFALLAFLIKLDSPGPVLFRQKRVGRNRRLFEIWKFRTMRQDAPANLPTHLLNHPERYITRLGRFLRKSSLDELPQLFQIFTGKMSFVGPRPALWNQTDLVEEREKYGANALRPGLTGWAQIHGRDTLSIKEKARLDGEYVRNISFRLDVACLLATVGAVLKQEGIEEGSKGKGEEAKEKQGEGNLPGIRRKKNRNDDT